MSSALTGPRHFLAAALLAAAALAPQAGAQTWDELADGGADAPRLVPGQLTLGVGPLTIITGVINNPDLDVDLYCIRVVDAAAFSVTMTEPNQGLTPQLWLFDAAGFGVAAAYDSTVPYTPMLTGLHVPGPGTYFLAISRPGAIPLDSSSQPIFPNNPNGQVPENPLAGTLAGWGIGSRAPGPYSLRLTSATFHSEGKAIDPCRTYTSIADFTSNGLLFNLMPFTDPATGDDCLKLPDQVRAWPFVAIPASARNTAVRIAVETIPAYGIQEGDVLGEYRTAPNGMQGNPSRTTVDQYGNFYITNRNEAGWTGAAFEGSVARVGIALGGTRVDAAGNPDPTGDYLAGPFAYCTCEDKDGDGLIKTSRGYAHGTGQPNADYQNTVLPWTNLPAGIDTLGGVASAEDECITAYVRVAGTNSRFVALDPVGDLWTGGTGNLLFEKVSGATALPVAGTVFNSLCSGYGGVVGHNNVLWSAQWGTSLLRYDAPGGPVQCLPNIDNYGVAIDPRTCNIWTTKVFGGTIREVDYQTNAIVGGPYPGGSSNAQGLAVDLAGNVWIAHSLLGGNTVNTVGRVTTAGAPLGNVNLDVNSLSIQGRGPTGVAIDSNDKVWTSNFYSHNAMRIDPASPPGSVDLVVDLGVGASPYSYGDMTGYNLMQSSAPQGSWTFIHDGGMPGCPWGTLSWNAIQDPGTNIIVRVRASDSIVPSGPFTVVQSGVPFSGVMGQYLQIQISLIRPPLCEGGGRVVLCDLTVCKDCTVTDDRVVCDPDNPGAVLYTGVVTNNSGADAHHILLTPLPPGSGVAITPNIINQVIVNGASAPFTVSITGLTPGEEFCFVVTLLDESMQSCCSTEVCITPDCDCLQVTPKSGTIVCNPATGAFTYTFTFDNLTNDTLHHAFFFPPSGVTFSPNYVALVPPVPGWATSQPITVQISGATPGQLLCFDMTIHDLLLNECCSQELCIQLPECGTPGPDGRAHLTAIAGLSNPAPRTTLTICNESGAEQSYQWSLRGLAPAPGCEAFLPPGAFMPAAGVTPPIPAGGCLDVVIALAPGFLEDNRTACIEATVVQAGHSGDLRARGQVVGRLCSVEVPSICSAARPAPGNNIVRLAPGIPGELAFELTNQSAKPATLRYTILASGPFLSLNGREPGMTVTAELTLGPGETGLAPVAVTIVEEMGNDVTDVVLYVKAAVEYPPARPAAAIGVQAGSPPCEADFNGDGTVDIQDFLAYLAAYSAGHPRADCDRNGSISIQDLLTYLSAFSNGC